MKIYRYILFSAALAISTTISAATNDGKLTKENIDLKTDSEINARIEVLERRLYEIRKMDFATLEKSERRALKDEVKEIKKEMALDGRITISIGAAILIVVLLILLL